EDGIRDFHVTGVQTCALPISSGTVFAGLEPNNFKKMMNQLDPKILIFQYGGNTVPYIKDSVAVENYARYIKNHIQWVRNKTDNRSEERRVGKECRTQRKK